MKKNLLLTNTELSLNICKLMINNRPRPSPVLVVVVFFWRDSRQRAMAYSFLRFLDHTQRRTTVGRTPLDEWSARRRDLYLTTQNTHNRQTSMPPAGFEPTVSAGDRPQTYALDRASIGIGHVSYIDCLNCSRSLLQPRLVPRLGYSAIHSVVAS